jgi:hypothetical protein
MVWCSRLGVLRNSHDKESALFVLFPGNRSSDVGLFDGLSGNLSRQIMPCVFHAASVVHANLVSSDLSLWDAVGVSYVPAADSLA